MPRNTAPILTHDLKESNFLKLSKRKIAGSGLLEKITFVQWHVSESIQKNTSNINVIRLATLLATFPRMGISGYDMSQNQLAKKMGELFDIPAPSRNAVSTWEHTLQKIGLLKIPKHHASKPKLRVFTEKFWLLSRARMPKLSYISLPVTFQTANVDPQVIPKDPILSVNSVSKKRACEDIVNARRQPHAVSRNKIYSRPPKKDPSCPRKLSKFENSIMFWLFQNKALSSYREGVILFARFLELGLENDYYSQLQRSWADCRDSSRPGLVAEMLRSMRSLGPGTGSADTQGHSFENLCPPLQIVKASNGNPADPEMAMLRNSLFFGAPYAGAFPEVVAEYKTTTPDRQDEIIEQLNAGKFIAGY